MGLAFNMSVVTRPLHLGAVIYAARTKMGMTQQALAYLAGTTSDAISQIESGERKPKWETLARLAAVLEIPLGGLDGPAAIEVAAARQPKPENEKADRALKDQRERMRKRHPER